MPNDMKNDAGEKMHTPAGYASTPAPVHTGPVLGVLVIILVLILGGLYLWGSVLKTSTAPEETPIVNNEPETPRADADVELLGTLSPSDELDAIEADITSTNVNSADSDIGAIDVELSGALGE